MTPTVNRKNKHQAGNGVAEAKAGCDEQCALVIDEPTGYRDQMLKRLSTDADEEIMTPASIMKAKELDQECARKENKPAEISPRQLVFV